MRRFYVAHINHPTPLLVGSVNNVLFICLLIGTFSKKTLPYICRMLKVAETSSQQDVSFTDDVVKITNTEAATISVLWK